MNSNYVPGMHPIIEMGKERGSASPLTNDKSLL